MEFATPDGLTVSETAVAEHGRAFILCHPVGEGPADMDTSVIFEAEAGSARVIRVFEAEVTGICVLGDALHCVDGKRNLYRHAGGEWTDFTGVGTGAGRINALRAVEGQVHGVGDDGLIYRWEGDGWTRITREIEDLYLYDLVEGPEGRLLVAGENGLLAEIAGGELNGWQVPTNVDLTSVLPLDDGSFLVTGWNATVLVGRRDGMSALDAGGRTLSFANAVRWGERILIAAASEVLEFRDGGLIPFTPDRALRLSAAKDQLWKHDETGPAYFADGRWIEAPLAVDL